MAFRFDTGIPLYKSWIGNDKPTYGSKGDIVRYKKQDWVLIDWDTETGDICDLVNCHSFEFCTADASRLVFVSRFAGDHWWERLPEVGQWAKTLSDRYRSAIAGFAEQVGILRNIEHEAMARATKRWTPEEIRNAKHPVQETEDADRTKSKRRSHRSGT